MKLKIMKLNNIKVKVRVPDKVISTEEFLKNICPKLDRVIERLDNGKINR